MAHYIICPNCGKTITADPSRTQVFCSECGQLIQYRIPTERPQYTQPAPQTVPIQSPPPAKRKANAVAIIGLVFACIGLFVSFATKSALIIVIPALIMSIIGFIISFTGKRDQVVPIIALVFSILAMVFCFALTHSGSSYSGSTSSREPVVDRQTYVESCEELDYKSLQRDPDYYKGRKIRITVEIAQVLEPGLLTQGGYRGYEDYEFNWEDPDSTFMDKEWFIEYELRAGESKILENDIIVFYGEFVGDTELERTLTHTKDKVPTIKVQYYEIISAN